MSPNYGRRTERFQGVLKLKSNWMTMLSGRAAGARTPRGPGDNPAALAEGVDEANASNAPTAAPEKTRRCFPAGRPHGWGAPWLRCRVRASIGHGTHNPTN